MLKRKAQALELGLDGSIQILKMATRAFPPLKSAIEDALWIAETVQVCIATGIFNTVP